MAELISAGPTSFATEGERRAAALLQQDLPSDWVIICNKVVPTNNGRSLEIDFIILARRWIFLLDEKSWKGRISGNDLQWVRADGSATKSPLNQIDFNAKVVAGQIKYKVTPLNQAGYFVRGGVLLSLQEHLPQIHDSRAANNVFLLSDVCQRLLKLDGAEGNPLVGHWQEKIKQALVHFPARPQVPRQIHSFKIDDAISPRPNMRIFDASVEGNAEEKYKLMVYDLGNDPFAAQQLNDFYQQEYRVIKKLQSTGLTPEAQVPFIWSEDYLVVAITPPAGKALKAWPLPETKEEFLQEVQFASYCFKALDQIHASGVIHRALGPEALYVQSMQPPKVMFTNFYAARTGTNTIAPSLDALSIEDPYASVDVAIGYEFASTITDTFSLALILLERLSGSSISSLRPKIDDKVIMPDRPRWSSFLTAEQTKELAEIFQGVIQPENGAKQPPAKELATRLAELARHARSTVNGEVGTILCKRYEVQRLLGQGAMAKTYLVKDTSFAELGSYVLKQFIRIDEEARQQAIAEYKALKDLSSKYIPRIEYIFPLEEDAHILMQYIPGPTLKQVEAEFPWPLESWWEFARHLLNAIDVLEQKTLLHRDIKPENIILHEEDNRPVFIDFGFAIQQGTQGHIAGTALYLPPEARSSAQTPSSADRYAAAIVLFQALTGSLPFSIATDGIRTILPLEIFEDQKVRRIATILQKAVSNHPDERPDSVNQLHNDLQVALLAVEEPVTAQELQEEVNDWVDSIRSLYQNSDAGNANNRGLDSDFVRDTYIPTMLDQQLLPLLFERLPKALFLSGNPGDGKTAFLEQVYLELQRRQATLVHKDASGWEVTYEGHTFRSCYDASESHKLLSADEQLSEKLHGLDGLQPERTNLTVLIAINDGRLFDFFQKQRAQFPWLAQQIDLATEAKDSEGQLVWLIDMKKRAFVGLPEADEPSIFSHILSSFVATGKWTICEQCAAQTVCPLRNNALALHKKKIAKRLEYLFLLTHLRRLSHITMRDLRSALAYLITGNKSCQDIHQMRSGTEIGSSLINLAYWQNTFTRTDMRDELLNNLTSLDPARFPRPHLDRFLHFHQASDDAALRSLLFIDKQDLPARRFKDSADWIAAVKRRLYFEAANPDSESSLPDVGWNLLLPYRFANKFWQLLDQRTNPEKILEQLALGILRSDEVLEEIPPGAMSIKISSSDTQQLVVLKQILLHEFELSVPEQLNTTMIEVLPEILVLQHKTGTPRLEITLDLFELLMQMAEGLQPNAREYEPLLEDLKLFKNALLLQDTQDLILVESQFHVHHIMQRDGKIIRQAL